MLGRARDRLAQRQVLLQPALVDQELLGAVEHLGQLAPERLRLMDERREDQKADQRDGAEDARGTGSGSRASAASASPIGSTFCRSIMRTIGLKPIASRPLT